MTAGLIVFSDLDGCLLDRDTYSFEPAREALEALRRRGVPVVPCTGKTQAETAPLVARLGLRTPFVVENGGGVVGPSDPAGWYGPLPGPNGPRLLALGVPRGRLLGELPRLARDAGVGLRGFSTMSPEEVAALTGLGTKEAALALHREFDEPFLVAGSEGRDEALDQELDACARRIGLRVSHGGRLHHLHGPHDKGHGVRAVLGLWAAPAVRTVALGDAASDLPLLQAVARPILVPGPSGVDPALAAALPRAECAPRPGPEGWNAALLSVLDGAVLPRVGA